MRLLLLFAIVPLLAQASWCAESTARQSHAYQWYGDFPFEWHLERVNEVLRRFGFRPSFPGDAAYYHTAWLHDILEDTPVTEELLRENFDAGVVDAVVALTLNLHLDRKAALLESLPRMARHRVSIAVKFADRIANVEACRANAQCFREYVSEWEYLRKPFRNLARTRRELALWAHLDRITRETE